MYNPHDLLRIDVTSVLKRNGDLPLWAQSSIQKTPYVVVRRGVNDRFSIPVGIRGASRSERCAITVSCEQVQSVLTPYELQTSENSRLRLKRAQETFGMLKELLRSMHWGPTGSVGFELASGTQAMNEQSDFDILIQSQWFSITEANNLMSQLNKTPMTVDPLIQTENGWFLLREYALGKGVLFKTMTGVELQGDPWRPSH